MKQLQNQKYFLNQCTSTCMFVGIKSFTGLDYLGLNIFNNFGRFGTPTKVGMASCFNYSFLPNCDG